MLTSRSDLAPLLIVLLLGGCPSSEPQECPDDDDVTTADDDDSGDDDDDDSSAPVNQPPGFVSMDIDAPSKITAQDPFTCLIVEAAVDGDRKHQRLSEYTCRCQTLTIR